MLLGAYRMNEVDEHHPLIKKMAALREENVHYDEMELSDLHYEDVHELVSGSLLSQQENISFLSDIIFSKTKGNAFYVWQFLRSIYDERLLWFDFDLQSWQWNAELIIQMNVSGNVVELMTDYVQKLPIETLDLLRTASTIGNRFDKRMLSVIKGMNENRLEALLNISISEGLLIPAGKEYKFAHDRIQQAVYSLIPENEKYELHLLNARKLDAHFSQQDLQEKIFELVNQWNLGASAITDKKEKSYLANLNWMAGYKAMAATAYPQGLQYFEKGIMLLDADEWNGQYEFFLKITTDAADAAYLSGAYNEVDKHVNNLYENSKTLIDSVAGYEIEIKKLIAQNKLPEAIKLGLSVLQKLGLKFPSKPGQLSVLFGLLKAKWILSGKTMESFNNLPLMQDEKRNAAMRIMSEISSAAYFAVPNLVPLLVFKMVEWSVRYGLSPKSPYSIATYGFILSVHMGEIEKGSYYGEIALHLSRKINAEEVSGTIIAISNLFLDHWKKPLPELKTDLEKAYRLTIEYGNNEWASYAAHNLVYQLFISGSRLPDLSHKAESLDLQIEKFKQDLTLKRLRLFRQAFENLFTEKAEPDLLTGNIYEESAMDITDVTNANGVYFQNLYLLKLQLAIIFNQADKEKKYLEYVHRFIDTAKGTSLEPLLHFYSSLAAVDSSANSRVNRSVLGRVKKDIRKLKKFEKISPLYNSHRSLLLKAEYNNLKGDTERAKIFYDKALTLATENGMLNDLALFWERAGQFFLNNRQELIAGFYLQNAYRAYKRWGAEAKVSQMEKRYPLLKPGITTAGGIPDFSSDTVTEHKGSLDLDTVLKASATISGEIVLPRLLRKMMNIIMENAGAQTGFLIMEKNNEWCIEAEIGEASDDVKVMHSIPVLKCGLLAESIINYVYQTQEPVILDDAGKSNLFSNDPFIETHTVKSVLCFPLVNMGRIQAIIYLSNDLTYGAFTEKRVALLKLLAAQMATSIENALFYNELENKVEERTNELFIEKKKSDDLLLNILPEVVAQELKQTGRTTPRSYEVATVMFTDFENFTSKSEKLSPEELVNIIDTCFKTFDEIISKHNLEKIKTIGDAYLCVSGLPDTKDHNAENAVKAAIEIVEAIRSFQEDENEKGFFNIRIGIHTGPLVAGVVGHKKFAYDIWGDTVNTAARMEQNSEPNRINISQSTYELVKDKFNCTFRGKQPAKNKGMIEMYFVEGEC
jgi:predicted ATPase/class 3 adenylate cyclase